MSPTKGAGKAADKPAARGRGRPSLSNEELLDKVLDLFLEQGFEGTSIDGIAATAGMAKRTLYLRYRDKETLFRAALERAIEEWIVPIEQLQAAECDDLETTLLSVGRILVNNVMKPEGLRLIRITNAESVRMPEIGVYTYQHGTQRTFAYLADLFRRRIGVSAVEPDWNEAAIAFVFLVVCGPPTVTVWGMSLDEAAIERHTRHSVRLFLYGLLPRGEAHAASAAPVDRAAPALSSDVIELQNENRRLRKLLLDSMLEVESLKEQREVSPP